MSLLERLERDGAAATLREEGGGMPDAARVMECLRRAVACKDDAQAALEHWDEAGRSHDTDALDEVISAMARRGPLPFVGARRVRRLAGSARRALAASERPGTLRLAAAILGEAGGKADVPALETVAAHPGLALHGVTALANLRHRDGLAALLRLLWRTEGETRVIVIDRLLAFCVEPAVRVALVRDAFTGLDEDLAREVAPAVADTLDLGHWLTEPRVGDDLREAARNVLRLAGRS